MWRELRHDKQGVRKFARTVIKVDMKDLKSRLIPVK